MIQEPGRAKNSRAVVGKMEGNCSEMGSTLSSIHLMLPTSKNKPIIPYLPAPDPKPPRFLSRPGLLLYSHTCLDTSTMIKEIYEGGTVFPADEDDWQGISILRYTAILKRMLLSNKNDFSSVYSFRMGGMRRFYTHRSGLQHGRNRKK